MLSGRLGGGVLTSSLGVGLNHSGADTPGRRGGWGQALWAGGRWSGRGRMGEASLEGGRGLRRKLLSGGPPLPSPPLPVCSAGAG